ncbi:hypothetical protein Calab_2778 [Caldithrix abyssi DSM 13497]|uniref:Uncharacterized protein n=1 Tax=Caldithrix abyssi DSM 13497 TaxID=880073 RepID=H1XQW2_CALAY|nr:hypothetical protein [Caldithrix abyssi]APF18374.1 hypothetical protein Cabys_1625 [Caldithrix abyssi DSM 13497]EHO42385.1 hypothetical protein Calab_2778 [Caldithrix abyssi DSM 13497]
MKKILVQQKRFFILLGAFLLFQIAFGLALDRLQQIAGTGQILDVRFHYAPHEAFELLRRYGSEGRKWYLFCLGIDMLYPLIYVLLLREIMKMASRAKSVLHYLKWTPFAIGALDYLENILEFKMVLGYPQSVLTTAAVSAWITSAKWTLVAALLSLIMLQMVLNLVQRRAGE